MVASMMLHKTRVVKTTDHHERQTLAIHMQGWSSPGREFEPHAE
jgi:hypothetical protein